MELKRFFAEKSDISDKTIVLRGDEFDHAVKVLRLKKGFKIIVSDDCGNDFYCSISDIEKDFLVAEIEKVVPNECATALPVKLFFALPKNDKVDFIAQKCVELGVGEAYVFDSDFVSETKFRGDRVERIMLEACKQCGRSRKAKLFGLLSFDEMLRELEKCDVKILAYENENQISFADISDFSGARDVAVVVGSEGGFSEREVEILKGIGVKSFSLGKRILRCETACVATLALVMYELGEMSL